MKVQFILKESFGKSYIELGSFPYDEDDGSRSRYLRMLKAKFPIPEDLVSLVSFEIKSFNLGEYSEVIIRYDPKIRKSEMFAFYVEKNLPDTWSNMEVFNFNEDYESIKNSAENTNSDDYYDASEEVVDFQQPQELQDFQWSEFKSAPRNQTRWDDVKSTLDASYAETQRTIALKAKTQLYKTLGLSDEDIQKLIQSTDNDQ